MQRGKSIRQYRIADDKILNCLNTYWPDIKTSTILPIRLVLKKDLKHHEMPLAMAKNCWEETWP